MLASKAFDDISNLRVPEDAVFIGSKQRHINIFRALLAKVTDQHRLDDRFKPVAFAERRRHFAQQLGNTAADIATAQQADIYLLHSSGPPKFLL